MNTKRIAGKTIEQWQETFPLSQEIMAGREVFWANPTYRSAQTAFKSIALSYEDMADARDRLKRFASFIAKVFPRTRENQGIIESTLQEIPKMKEKLNFSGNASVCGTLLLKCDHLFAVSGSIKARGGINLGLKLFFGDHAHCFFAEPTFSPCMLIGLMTGLHDKVGVKDFGLSNITDADVLAVGRSSGLVGKTLARLLSGSYTVTDNTLCRLLHTIADQESIFLEPSAAAGLPGPAGLLNTPEGRNYMGRQGLIENMAEATHLVWGTGRGMVPEPVMQAYLKKGLSHRLGGNIDILKTWSHT